MVIHDLKRPILVLPVKCQMNCQKAKIFERPCLPPTLVTIQSGMHNAAIAKQSAMRNRVKEMPESLSIIGEIELHHSQLLQFLPFSAFVIVASFQTQLV